MHVFRLGLSVKHTVHQVFQHVLRGLCSLSEHSFFSPSVSFSRGQSFFGTDSTAGVRRRLQAAADAQSQARAHAEVGGSAVERKQQEHEVKNPRTAAEPSAKNAGGDGTHGFTDTDSAFPSQDASSSEKEQQEAKQSLGQSTKQRESEEHASKQWEEQANKQHNEQSAKVQEREEMAIKQRSEQLSKQQGEHTTKQRQNEELAAKQREEQASKQREKQQEQTNKLREDREEHADEQRESRNEDEQASEPHQQVATEHRGTQKREKKATGTPQDSAWDWSRKGTADSVQNMLQMALSFSHSVASSLGPLGPEIFSVLGLGDARRGELTFLILLPVACVSCTLSASWCNSSCVSFIRSFALMHVFFFCSHSSCCFVSLLH